jgi:hypothetical protein
VYTQRYEKRKRLTGKYSLQYRQYTVDLKILDFVTSIITYIINKLRFANILS